MRSRSLSGSGPSQAIRARRSLSGSGPSQAIRARRSLLEREGVGHPAGDTCKTHGASLLLEDIGKPFNSRIKSAHEMIIFIVSHDVVMGIFAKSGARALLMPAGTRFATEVICFGSLRKDKQEGRAEALRGH